MRKHLFFLVAVSFLAVWPASPCLADTPGIVNYQGRVVVNGTNYDGTGQFKFSLVDGGTFLYLPPLPPRWVYKTYWSHDGSGSAGSAPTSSVAVAVSQGLYSVMLGDTNLSGMTQPIPPSVFTNKAVYLRVWFDDGTNGVQRIAPDQRVAAVGYALQAASVQTGGITSEMLANGAVTSSKIAAAAVQPYHLDRSDEVAFESFLEAVDSLGGGSSMALTDLAPVTATNGVPPAFTFNVNGSAFGTVIGFSGSEGISDPYAYVVQAAYPGAVVDPATQVGRVGRLSFTRNGRTTTFGGLITACNVASSGTNLLYTFRLESPLAWLALSSDYRIYQQINVPELAAQIYDELTASSFDRVLSGSYSPHENLIQYGETALNFFRRLLEHEGIFYFFNQANNPPSLVLGDATGSYLSSPNSPFAYYGNNATNAPVAAERIRTFQKAIHESTLKSTLDGYNLTKPNFSLLQTATGTAGRGENYEFGTDLATTDYHRDLATARLERQNVERATATGSATAPDLRAGYTFTLTDTTGSGFGGTYLVTSVRHAGFCRVTNGVSTLYYANEFEVIPATQTFRPAVKTPKPLAQVCTAVVTGPAGERVHVDKYGRVKVSFHWDRSGVTDDRSSAWLRVASPMAGTSYDGHGMLFLPRVGDEVLVSFIQGDPNQPVVTGSLYNGDAMPPYALPDNKMRSTIRTVSESVNVNEIRFDDTAGSEELAIFAGKDLTVDADNDSSFSVGRSFTSTVGNNFTSTVGSSYDLTIGQDFAVQAPSGLLSLHASGIEIIADLDRTINASRNAVDTVGNNLTSTVGNNFNLTVGKDFTVQAASGLNFQAPQIAMNGSLTINGVPYTTNVVSTWAAVAANGTISAQQGIASVVNNQQGYYTVTVSRAAPSAAALIPIAMPNLNALPTTPAAMRVAAVDQVTSSSFRVYIMSGTGVATNSAFVVMVTGN